VDVASRYGGWVDELLAIAAAPFLIVPRALCLVCRSCLVSLPKNKFDNGQKSKSK
jgi:hypothetical protein